VFNFGRTLIGFKKDKILSLMNDGVIPAFLTVTASSSPDF
jgi:hypothetical protein